MIHSSRKQTPHFSHRIVPSPNIPSSNLNYQLSSTNLVSLGTANLGRGDNLGDIVGWLGDRTVLGSTLVLGSWVASRALDGGELSLGGGLVDWCLDGVLGGAGDGLGDLGLTLDGAGGVAWNQGGVRSGDDSLDPAGGCGGDLGGGVDGLGHDLGGCEGGGDGCWLGGADGEGLGDGLGLVLVLAG